MWRLLERDLLNHSNIFGVNLDAPRESKLDAPRETQASTISSSASGVQHIGIASQADESDALRIQDKRKLPCFPDTTRS